MESISVAGREQTPIAGKKEKRFQCQHCHRLFARLEHLQRHERIHSGVKPFSCAECNYSFTRSDLLVRHERLTHHKGNSQRSQQNPNDDTPQSDARPPKRSRSSIDNARHVPDIPSLLSPPSAVPLDRHTYLGPQPQIPVTPQGGSQHEEFSLAALSMAAEYQSLHGTLGSSAASPYGPSFQRPDEHERSDAATTVAGPMNSTTSLHNTGPDLGDSLDSLAAFLEHEPLSSFHFSALINTEQPMPFFSPDSYSCTQDLFPQAESPKPAHVHRSQAQHEEPHSFSRFGSRLPSLQPEGPDQVGGHTRRPLAEVSVGDRVKILQRLEEFAEVIPHDFRLPTRLALCRYIAAYISGFDEHMPFLHIPTMSVETCSLELILAIAAVGAQYTFEGEKGVDLFNASRAIATYRIRRRDTRLVEYYRYVESERSSSHDNDGTPTGRSPRKSSTSGPLGLPSDPEASENGEDLMQTAQALLLLMALSTWAKHREILREALAIQSILATLIRDDGLENEPLREELSWKDWVRRETIKRTKFIVYGFSNLHCIVYNIPPFILTSEVKLTLPCRAAEFKAETEAAWRDARRLSPPETQFQDALQRLFSKTGKYVTETISSSGNYALMHAIIQHIFILRQVARGRFDGTGDISTEDVASIEVALRNWQTGWRRNPESSLDPMSPNGPVAFNSTALLRLAYIRLYVDTAGRALDTRDPAMIANALRNGPVIRRSSKITRAVLHSAHALSIPIKIGYRLVAKTQSFIWSIQHSLCTLECGYLLSKWLEALSPPLGEPSLTEDERRIVAIVKSMLDETEFAPPSDVAMNSPAYMKYLSAGVLRVWATIFKGSQTWAIVDVIGSALNLYADMLEAG